MDPRAASLLDELKRRRVFRALVGYGIAAFALLQIIHDPGNLRLRGNRRNRQMRAVGYKPWAQAPWYRRASPG